ncbi:hypothetical protein [Pyxidicoccus caerfyrddinensis]|uniref:hypothetical protein n=1 Tax=Pyxidicoccus caerfyrddinensis TaxID=2709663 RepID=UPI0013DB4901|nr:hypothetical protein [Pyxidicoccus caerfyrddinensis]
MNKYASLALVISLALTGCNAPVEGETDTSTPEISQDTAAPEEGADGRVTAMAGVCFNGYRAGLSCNSSVECGKFCASGPKVNQYCNSAADCGKWCSSGSRVNLSCNFNTDCPGSTCVSTTCIQATCG